VSTIHAQSIDGHHLIIYDPEDMMKQEFVCPKCGGHNFSNLGRNDDNSLDYYCTSNPSECKFKWNSKENALYFHLKERYKNDNSK
jgi:hypothetical protein